MKRCNQCFQTYTDDYSFCLTDGTSLVYIADTSSQPTIAAPAPNFQFPTPAPPPSSASQNSGMKIAVGAIALLVLIALGLGGYFLLSGSKNDVSSKNENKNANVGANTEKTNADQERLDLEKANLQLQRDQIELEKQKLDREKNKLKQQNTPQPSGSYTLAQVPKPVTNVRETPGGGVLCKITYQATIKIYGSTNVADNNGVWYYTDFCGTMGVVHSSQFRFN